MKTEEKVAHQNQTLTLFPEPSTHTRKIPSSTYTGNGTFTVRASGFAPHVGLAESPCTL